MPEKPQEQVELTDPRALRAYAHPTRMTLVGLLRTEGPFTATRAAELTGESVASCSYHLRILAKYGLVEEADPDGPGRDKPWRATAAFTGWPSYSADPTVASATQALNTAVAELQFHRMLQAMESHHTLPPQWQEAERHSDAMLYLTPEELRELGERVDAMVTEYVERGYDPAQRPEGARRVAFVSIAYVDPDHRGQYGPGQSPPAGEEA